MRKFLVLTTLVLSLCCTGCIYDYTTIGMCLLGNNSGTNCGWSPIDPNKPPEIPLPDPYIGFKIQTAVWDARSALRQAIYDADSILIAGQYIGNGTGVQAQGDMMAINDFTQPDTSPLPGFYNCTSCTIPGTWDLTWVTSSQSNKIKSLNFIDPTTQIRRDVCAGQPQFEPDLIPGQLVKMVCIVTIQSLLGGDNIELAGTTSSDTPSVQIAGAIRDMSITSANPLPIVGAYTQGRVYVLTYDQTGANVGCIGYVVGCGADVTVTGSNTLSLPGWALAWTDSSAAGNYAGEIFALDATGTWQSVDFFTFQITNGGEPVYRFYNPCTGDHYFTVQAYGPGGCYYLENSAAFYTYPFVPFTDSPIVGSPVNVLMSPQGYFFMTADINESNVLECCNGFVAFSNLGRFLPWQSQNTIPLYRERMGTTGIHFWTASWGELQSTLAPQPVQLWQPGYFYYDCSGDGCTCRRVYQPGYWYTGYVASQWVYEGVAGWLPDGP
jgi:uncharacterized protein DUF5648